MTCKKKVLTLQEHTTYVDNVVSHSLMFMVKSVSIIPECIVVP